MTPFAPLAGLIFVTAEVFGPAGSITVRLALDTGATNTLIGASILTSIGYDLVAQTRRVRITTASGVVSVPRIAVQSLVALGQTHSPFAVVAHTLPPSSGIDGLLGLDFVRGLELTIDFRSGVIRLA